jgi:hypothetical protein
MKPLVNMLLEESRNKFFLNGKLCIYIATLILGFAFEIRILGEIKSCSKTVENEREKRQKKCTMGALALKIGGNKHLKCEYKIP